MASKCKSNGLITSFQVRKGVCYIARPLLANAADLRLLVPMHATLATTARMIGFPRMRPLSFREGRLILGDAASSTLTPLLAI